MKKIYSNITLFLMFALLLGMKATAQTPQYVFTGTGSNNIFPFSSTTNKVQWLYDAAQFSPSIVMGQITKVYFRSLSTNSTTAYTDLTIKIGTTTITAMPSGGGVWYTTGMQTCLYAASYSMGSVTSGSWFSFALPTPFFYDGTSNFIVEVSQTAYTGGITIQQSASTGSRRQWGSSTSTTITSSGTGQAELGVDIIPGSPCPRSTALPATNIASTSATMNWTPVSGSYQYEYVIDTTTPGSMLTTPVITSNTSAFVTGLIPGKTHYLRVRNYCSAPSYSVWDTISFNTLPPCKVPFGVVVSAVDSNSASFAWSSATNVLQYQYVVNTIRNNPTSSTPYFTTTGTFVALPDTCKDGSVYYIHIRAKCVANDSSGWSLDSFRTPVPCRRPILSLTHLTHDNSITSWPAVNTAYQYEYYLGPISTMPPNGTPITTTYVQTPYLIPSTGYTMSVRCMCNDFGIKSSSAWANIDFTTLPPTGISSLNSDIQLIVFPNPAKEKVMVSVKGKKLHDANISITDLNGRVVKTSEVNNDITEINVSGLSKGMYFLRLSSEGNIMNTKLVIQ